MVCTIGSEYLSEGQTYCDANGNLFKCVNGTLQYVSTGCAKAASGCDCTTSHDPIWDAACFIECALVNVGTVFTGSTPAIDHTCDGSYQPNQTKCDSHDGNTYICKDSSYGAGWAIDHTGCGTIAPSTSNCNVGTETIVNGNTYYDGVNTFLCQNGSMKYQPPPFIPSDTDYYTPASPPLANPAPTNPLYVDPMAANLKPTANLIISPKSGVSPLVVKFTANNTGTVTSSTLDYLGIGYTVPLNSGSITNTYTTPGTFHITYTVSNSYGSSIFTDTIVVTSTSSTPAPTTCPASACPGTQVCSATTGFVCKDKPVVQVGVTSGAGSGAGAGAGAGSGAGSGTGAGAGAGSGAGSGTGTKCVGMNRNGALDLSCALETGNEMYLYGAIGLVLLFVLMKNK
jgi:PKD repeat protein